MAPFALYYFQANNDFAEGKRILFLICVFCLENIRTMFNLVDMFYHANSVYACVNSRYVATSASCLMLLKSQIGPRGFENC
jgi:hypothetical protein